MNWFERYAVVGTYFLVILFLGLWSLGLCNMFETTTDTKAIIALLVFAVLPAGYFMSLISQILYYWGIAGMQVHKEAVRGLENSSKEKLGIYEYEHEKILETKITIKTRLLRNNSGIEFLSKFASKRWDLLALNSAIKLSTLSIIIILLITKVYKTGAFIFSSQEIIVFLVGAIWYLAILIISNKIDRVSLEQLIRIIHSMIEEACREQAGVGSQVSQK